MAYSPVGRSLARWGLLVGGFYLAILAAWLLGRHAYLWALAADLRLVGAAGLLPPGAQVYVAGPGLAMFGAGAAPIGVPMTVLGADLALTLALVLASRWLRWRVRVRRAAVALLVVFCAHLVTVVAQAWITWSAADPATRAVWSMYTTLYQAKVVPLLVWVVLAGRPLLDATAFRVQARAQTG